MSPSQVKDPLACCLFILLLGNVWYGTRNARIHRFEIQMLIRKAILKTNASTQVVKSGSAVAQEAFACRIAHLLQPHQPDCSLSSISFRFPSQRLTCWQDPRPPFGEELPILHRVLQTMKAPTNPTSKRPVIIVYVDLFPDCEFLSAAVPLQFVFSASVSRIYGITRRVLQNGAYCRPIVGSAILPNLAEDIWRYVDQLLLLFRQY